MPSRKKAGPNWFDRLKLQINGWFGKREFLCDTCKWDWRGACRHQERPNAVWCEDYEKRG
ncbi:MAG: hypothetical protein P8105_06270 [Dehalococcoidia bacterium]